MSLSKQSLKSKPITKVTFLVPAEIGTGAEKVAVVGEFNSWDVNATPLKKQKDGSFKTTVELSTGQEYQFRYLIDGTNWVNDSEADKYVSSGISFEENSVVVL